MLMRQISLIALVMCWTAVARADQPISNRDAFLSMARRDALNPSVPKPESARLLIALAAAEADSNPDQSKSDLSAAAVLNPKAPELVKAFADRSDWDAAEKTLNALPADAQRVDAALGLIGQLGEAGESDRAQSIRNRLVPEDQRPKANRLLAIGLVRAHRLDDALAVLPAGQEVPAAVLLDSGYDAQANDRIAGETPVQAVIDHLEIAVVQQRRGDDPAATASVAAAVDVLGRIQDPSQRLQLLSKLITAQIALGQIEQARPRLAELQSLIDKDADHSWTAVAMAAGLWARCGDLARGQLLLDRIPADQKSLRNQVQLEFARGEAAAGEVKPAIALATEADATGDELRRLARSAAEARYLVQAAHAAEQTTDPRTRAWLEIGCAQGSGD